MSLTTLLVPTYRQMLNALAGWLQKAQAPVDDADAFMSARLAPDMFPLSTQVRFACRQAREGAHRLQHQTFPAAVELLLEEGRQGGERPGTISDALVRIEENDRIPRQLVGVRARRGAKQPLVLELPMGIAFDMDGEHYVRDWALPQFYFHVMTAYGILRGEASASVRSTTWKTCLRIAAYRRGLSKPTASVGRQRE